MRYLFLLPLLLIFFAGCRQEDRTRLPAGLTADSVIPRDEMILILADVHLLEAALQANSAKGTNIDRMSEFYYKKLFSRYHTSDKRFRKNLEYYQQKPENFSKMYEEVVSRLSSFDKQSKPR